MGPGCYACSTANPHGLQLSFDLGPDGDIVRAIFVPRPHHCGAEGFLHGGVLATCLDETMAAVGPIFRDVRYLTAKLDLKFTEPVPIDGGPVLVEAWAETWHATSYLARGRIRREGRGVGASARGLFAVAPGAVKG